MFTQASISLSPSCKVLGRVVDQVTGQSIAGVSIAVRVHSRHENDNAHTIVKTDSNGEHTVTLFPKTPYSL